MQVILYPLGDGGIAIVRPTSSGLSIAECAAISVPPGVLYKIVDDSVLPSDRTFRDAWTADFSESDGTGADYGYGSKNEIVGYNADGDPVVKMYGLTSADGGPVLRVKGVE